MRLMPCCVLHLSVVPNPNLNPMHTNKADLLHSAELHVKKKYNIASVRKRGGLKEVSSLRM